MKGLVLTVLLAAVPVFATDIPLAEPPIGPAQGFRSPAVAATASDRSLVTWYEATNNTLAGIRLDEHGTSIDAMPLTLAIGGGYTMAIASDGGGWLIGTTTSTFNQLRFFIVSPEGTATESGIQITGSNPSITYSGSNYVIAYSRDGSLRVAVVSRDGALVNDDEVFTDSVFAYTVVATTPGHVALVWSRNGAIATTTLDVSALASGTATLGPIAAIGQSFSEVAAAWNGSELLVIWPRQNDEVRGSRVTAAGVVGPFVLPKQGHSVKPPVPIGSQWLVNYLDSQTFASFFTLIDATGQALSSHTLPGLPQTPLKVADGTAVAVTATIEINKPSQIIAQPLRTSPALTPGETVVLTRSRAAQRDLQIARCGGDTLTAWREGSDVERVMFRRLGPSGAPKSAPLTIWQSPARLDSLRIACTADSTMLLWNDATRDPRPVQGAALDAHDVVTKIFDVGVTPAIAPASIASDGQSYVIAYPDRLMRELHFFRWQKDGEPIDTVPSILYLASDEEYFGSVYLAATGDGYLAVIERTYWLFPTVIFDPFIPMTQRRLQAIRLTSNFTISSNPADLTSRPIRLTAEAPFYDDGPSVSGVSLVCDTICAVTRLQSSNSNASFLPRVTRLDQSGHLLDPADGIALPVPLPALTSLTAPSALWLGSRLIVAADTALDEVRADGSASALALLPTGDDAVGVMQTPLGLATLIQRNEGWNSAPRLYLRLPSMRRRGV